MKFCLSCVALTRLVSFIFKAVLGVLAFLTMRHFLRMLYYDKTSVKNIVTTQLSNVH